MTTSLLVATDFSAAADLALDRAIELARALNAGIELLHIHSIRTATLPPTLDVASVPPSARDVSRGEVMLSDRAALVRDAGIPCQTESRFGNSAEEIVGRAAQTLPLMIVMGTHGHSALMHALLGGVSERVLRNTRTPVLLVPWSRDQGRA